MRKRLAMIFAVATAMAIMLPSSIGGATHTGSGNGCAGNAANTLANPQDVKVDSVDDGQIDKWRVQLGAGERGYLYSQWLNGDVDIYVCKVGGGAAHVCASPNMYPVGDGCHFEELDFNDPVLDVRVMDWGARLQGPGTFWVHVQHCFSSQDIPDGGAQGACDYATVLPGTAGGELDALPAVQYVMTYAMDDQIIP